MIINDLRLIFFF